jgi:ubiquinone/menaquinone biosynthesis C-methylase UbiE
LLIRTRFGNRFDFFAKNIRENHLEVAIGSGTLFGMILGYLRWKGRSLPLTVGMDYAPPMLAGAQHRFKNQKNICLYKASVTHLPETDDTFRTVNIANAFHCFPEPAAALREIHRVLAPGGTLAMNVILYPKKTGFLLAHCPGHQPMGQTQGDPF